MLSLLKRWSLGFVFVLFLFLGAGGSYLWAQDVNGAGIAVDAPFGGYKHSGIGREAGQEGLTEFLEVKSVGGWN